MTGKNKRRYIVTVTDLRMRQKEIKKDIILLVMVVKSQGIDPR